MSLYENDLKKDDNSEIDFINETFNRIERVISNNIFDIDYENINKLSKVISEERRYLNPEEFPKEEKNLGLIVLFFYYFSSIIYNMHVPYKGKFISIYNINKNFDFKVRDLLYENLLLIDSMNYTTFSENIKTFFEKNNISSNIDRVNDLYEMIHKEKFFSTVFSRSNDNVLHFIEKMRKNYVTFHRDMYLNRLTYLCYLINRNTGMLNLFTDPLLPVFSPHIFSTLIKFSCLYPKKYSFKEDEDLSYLKDYIVPYTLYILKLISEESLVSPPFVDYWFLEYRRKNDLYIHRIESNNF